MEYLLAIKNYFLMRAHRCSLGSLELLLDMHNGTFSNGKSFVGFTVQRFYN